MNRDEVLRNIVNAIDNKLITRDEVNNLFDTRAHTEKIETSVSSERMQIARVLCYIGGIIVALGITILIARNWETLDTPTKLLATLGSSIALLISSTIFFSKPLSDKIAGSALYLISALVMPLGIWIVINRLGFSAHSYLSQAVIFEIMSVIALAMLWFFRENIFVLFSILFSTWVWVALTSHMAAGNIINSFAWKFDCYRAFIAGISYILIGYGFLDKKQKSLTGFLYSIGSLAVFISAFALGNFKPDQNIFWDAVYPIIILSALYLSSYLKSQSIVCFGYLFMIAYIAKISNEYFHSYFTWPMILVLAGSLLIGIGLFLKRNKRSHKNITQDNVV